jgi:copper homeostasis protein
MIKQLMLQADDRIIIMPGSGVNAENIVSIAQSTGAVEFHSSASMFVNSIMKYENESLDEKLKHIIVNKDEVKKMAALLKQLSNSATVK